MESAFYRAAPPGSRGPPPPPDKQRYPPPVLPPPPLLTSWQRFKPERRFPFNVQRLQWTSDLVSSMTIADVSPRFAVKRIILLYENAQYREAANFVNRLSHATFKTILSQLPIDVFIEAMPHSLSILEALYAKVFLSSDCGLKILRPENVLMQLVKILAGGVSDRYIGSARKLIKVIVLSEPKLKKTLILKKRSLDKAVEGLGLHGLIGTSDESMTNLHDALKVEFQRLIETYKSALQKLEDLSLSHKKSQGTPIQASHQRQLSLRQTDIQERLIKNQTLLNAVEPATSNRSAAILLAILQRRVDADKDALFQFTQLRKELKMDSEQVVAPLLMRYSRACQQVLDLMKESGDEAEDEEDSSDISGYHSDSDSAIMTSGNSPYVTKGARHNFLTRSVRSGSARSGRTCLPLSRSSSSESPQDRGSTTEWEWSGGKSSCNSLTLKNKLIKPWCTSCEDRAVLQLGVEQQAEVTALQGELEKTRLELEQTRARLEAIDKQQHARELSCVRLVGCYGQLYRQGRAEALNALDQLQPLAHSQELKSKILFSVIVLSFRACSSQLSTLRGQVRRTLLGPAPRAQAHTELEEAIAAYLRRTVDTFDLTHSIEEVSCQLYATLYDYPCLKNCSGLGQYIRDCVRLAWALVNQEKGYKLEYEERQFQRELHVRCHTADPDSTAIKTYLWPALVESTTPATTPSVATATTSHITTNCLYKAVVLT